MPRTYVKKHDTSLLEEDEVAEISEIFKALDQSGRGRLPTDKLVSCLRLLGINLGKEEALDL